MRLHHGKQKLCSRHHLGPVGRHWGRRVLSGAQLPGSWGSHRPPISIDDANTAAPAQLFHARDEVAIRLHIIAFRFHDHHEISRPFHVEQHPRLAFALRKQQMQRVDRCFVAAFDRNPDAQRPRQWHLRVFERNDFRGRNLRIRSFFHAHPGFTSTGTSSFTFSCSRRYASGKTIMSIEPDISSSVACA